MGGGSGGSVRWPSNNEAEKKARETFESARERRNLFISFAHEDLDSVNLFRASAKNEKSDIEFIDRSVKKPFDSENDPYIKQQISQRIKQSSMTAVYLTDHSANSNWVDWEVTQSLKLGKDVIAFYAGDKPPANIPDSVKQNGIKVVPWSDVDKVLSKK